MSTPDEQAYPYGNPSAQPAPGWSAAPPSAPPGSVPSGTPGTPYGASGTPYGAPAAPPPAPFPGYGPAPQQTAPPFTGYGAPAAPPASPPGQAGYPGAAAPAAPAFGAPPFPSASGFAPVEGTPVAQGFGTALDAPLATRSPAAGRLALIFGLLAALVAPAIAAIAAIPIGPALGALVTGGGRLDGDLSWLTPVAGSELIAEIAAYGCVLLALFAIVFGIVAVVQRRGRKAGRWGIILGILAPIVYTLAVGAVILIGSGRLF